MSQEPAVRPQVVAKTKNKLHFSAFLSLAISIFLLGEMNRRQDVLTGPGWLGWRKDLLNERRSVS